MPTYFFDPDLGNDANPGTSEAAPKRSLDVFLAAGSMTFSDEARLKRGARHILSTSRTLPNGQVDRPTKLTAYGVAQVPYAFVENPSGAGSYAINLSQRSWITLEDLRFDANAGLGAVYWSSTGLGNATDGVVRRCLFTGTAGGDRAGLYIGRENTTNVARRFLVEDCEFFGNSASGITLVAVQIARIRRCKAWGNGWGGPGGGHGIHTQSRHVFVTSGWTLVSGTIYSRTLAAHELDVFYARHPSFPALTKNTATPTAPSIGQFGVSGGLLYVNVNADPNGPTMAYVWMPSSDIEYEDCEAWANKFGIAPFQEGHGISMDDWTESSRILGCHSHDNEGLGISLNGGNNNLVSGCLIEGNEARGISAGSGTGTRVYNNTVRNNNRGRGAADNEIGFTATSTGSSTANNLIVTSRSYGVNFGGASGCASTTDLVRGATIGAILGGSASGTMTYDPAPFLDSAGRPRAMRLPDNPLASAGTYFQGIRLMGGRRPIPGRVPVGAYPEVRAA